MRLRTDRVPEPVIVGKVDPALLSGLAEIVPLDHGHRDDYSVRSIMKELSANADDLAKLVQPIAHMAIEHYTNDMGVEPTDARISVKNADTRRAKAENWHRDQLFPSGRHYIVSSAASTEFLAGEGLPLLNTLPQSLSLNSLVNWLMRRI